MSKASRARELARRLATAATTGRPRNPTGTQRVRGEPRLSPEEWRILRDWQTEQCAQHVDSESDKEARATLHGKVALGSIPWTPPTEEQREPSI